MSITLTEARVRPDDAADNDAPSGRAVATSAKEPSLSVRAGVGGRPAQEAVRQGTRVAVYRWVTSIKDPSARAWAELGAGQGLGKSKDDLEITSPPIYIGSGGSLGP